jgi:hypothetical protein
MTEKTKRKRVRHFTAKSAARCIAYARRDGASDKEIIKYVIEAYGLTNASCIVANSMTVLMKKLFLDNSIALLGGALVFIKGFSIVLTGKISRLSVNVIDHIVRIYFPELAVSYGLLVVWTGATIVFMQSLIDLLVAFQSNINFYFFVADACAVEIKEKPFPIQPPPPDFQLYIIDERPADESLSYIQRFVDLSESVFQTDSNYLPPNNNDNSPQP